MDFFSSDSRSPDLYIGVTELILNIDRKVPEYREQQNINNRGNQWADLILHRNDHGKPLGPAHFIIFSADRPISISLILKKKSLGKVKYEKEISRILLDEEEETRNWFWIVVIFFQKKEYHYWKYSHGQNPKKSGNSF